MEKDEAAAADAAKKLTIENVPPGSSASLDEGLDVAYRFAKEHHVETLSEADNKRILRRIDTHLLPLVSRHILAWRSASLPRIGAKC